MWQPHAAVVHYNAWCARTKLNDDRVVKGPRELGTKGESKEENSSSRRRRYIHQNSMGHMVNIDPFFWEPSPPNPKSKVISASPIVTLEFKHSLFLGDGKCNFRLSILRSPAHFHCEKNRKRNTKEWTIFQLLWLSYLLQISSPKWTKPRPKPLVVSGFLFFMLSCFLKPMPKSLSFSSFQTLKWMDLTMH